MISVFHSRAAERGFDSKRRQTNDNNIIVYLPLDTVHWKLRHRKTTIYKVKDSYFSVFFSWNEHVYVYLQNMKSLRIDIHNLHICKLKNITILFITSLKGDQIIFPPFYIDSQISVHRKFKK
jgi:hypothetical protein